jgi:hypothetical protein
MGVLRNSFAEARDRLGLRLVHWSVQGNHVHMIVESEGKSALARGMQGLSVRIARGLNGLLGRRGRVFGDRYHARALATPRETRNALAYVLLNRRHHHRERGLPVPLGLDPCSSACSFDGWKRKPAVQAETVLATVRAPRTWLLREGWRRHGLIDAREVPGGPHPRRSRPTSRLSIASSGP